MVIPLGPHSVHTWWGPKGFVNWFIKKSDHEKKRAIFNGPRCKAGPEWDQGWRRYTSCEGQGPNKTRGRLQLPASQFSESPAPRLASLIKSTSSHRHSERLSLPLLTTCLLPHRGKSGIPAILTSNLTYINLAPLLNHHHPTRRRAIPSHTYIARTLRQPGTAGNDVGLEIGSSWFL